MANITGSFAAPERVAALRAEAKTNPSMLPELADNLLQLSRSLDQHNDLSPAFEAARDGIMALAQTDFAGDQELTGLMVRLSLSISRSRIAVG